jgi:hypothetical protein
MPGCDFSAAGGWATKDLLWHDAGLILSETVIGAESDTTSDPILHLILL